MNQWGVADPICVRFSAFYLCYCYNPILISLIHFLLYNIIKRRNKEIIPQNNNQKQTATTTKQWVYLMLIICACMKANLLEYGRFHGGPYSRENQMEHPSIASGTSWEPNPSMFHSFFFLDFVQVLYTQLQPANSFMQWWCHVWQILFYHRRSLSGAFIIISAS